MNLKILAEGSTKLQRFIKHWGLSILIDDDILFDTFGQPGYVLKQIKRYHIDPYKISTIVISHDDWDHIAGLKDFLELGKVRSLYICPNCAPSIKSMIKSYGVNAIEAYKPTQIRENIFLSGELKGTLRSGVHIPEQYMAIKASAGVVVITGCAHPGVIAIVRHAKENFGGSIDLLIGGLHLKDNPYDINRGIVRELKDMGVHRVAPLHCTGHSAHDIFQAEYGQDYIKPDSAWMHV